MALSKQDINLEDAIDIREIHNIKMANQLIKIKAKEENKKLSNNNKCKCNKCRQQQMEITQMKAQADAAKNTNGNPV